MGLGLGDGCATGLGDGWGCAVGLGLGLGDLGAGLGLGEGWGDGEGDAVAVRPHALKLQHGLEQTVPIRGSPTSNGKLKGCTRVPLAGCAVRLTPSRVP